MGLNHLRRHGEWQEMADRIKNIADGRPFVYVQNNGNWGDRLIHEGAIQFLAAFDIPYEQWDKNDVEKRLAGSPEHRAKAASSVLLYGGNGGWGRVWSVARKAVRSFAPHFHHTVVLPTTYDLPEVESRNVTYFRRDRTESADVIKQSIFCHDTAFFYDSNLEFRPPQVDIGYFYRDDKEQDAGSQSNPYSFDLSALGTHKSNIDPFFQIMSVYRSVSTDRLHVGIGATLLGLKTDLRPSSYWKVRAIFESSIQPNYDYVTFARWT